MVEDIGADISSRISASGVAEDQQSELLALLQNYQRDFHALVEQNERIGRLTREMFDAAARITPLVENNLAEATATMARQSAAIANEAEARARWSLIIAAIAPLLGLLLGLVITARIVRPVRRMVGLLDQLTREAPRERLETDPAGRDEINDMAIALNTLADHRARFADWWRSSMQAAIACRDLSETESGDERMRAALEMHKAFGAKLARLDVERERMLEEATRLEIIAEQQTGDARGRASAKTLRSVAGSLRALAHMIEAS
jgi:methyl-accepting chemotaxis protein